MIDTQGTVRSLLLVLVACLPVTVMAQTPGVDYERFLLPVMIQEDVPGAFESLWDTTFWLRNTGDVPIDAFPINACAPQPCPPGPGNALIPAGITFQPVTAAGTVQVAGTFLYVDRRTADALSAELRVQDLSRQAQTWGTEVPVVRESEAATGRLSLFPIPANDAFRVRLRIYAFDPTHMGPVVVRVFVLDPTRQRPDAGIPSDRLVGERTYEFMVTDPHSRGVYPAYRELGDLRDIGIFTNADLLRVEVQPAATGLRFWAFAAVTNNATQHLTLVTPN